MLRAQGRVCFQGSRIITHLPARYTHTHTGKHLFEWGYDPLRLCVCIHVDLVVNLNLDAVILSPGLSVASVYVWQGGHDVETGGRVFHPVVGENHPAVEYN